MVKRAVIFATIIAFCVLSKVVSAGVPTIYANDVFHREPGELFEVEIIVDCHAEVANYTVTVTLHPRFTFEEEGSVMNVSGDNASITYLGYDTDSLRFEFPMKALNDTPEGDYNIPYQVQWNGSETGFVLTLVESDSVTVSIGEGGSESPCSTSGFILLPLFAIGAAFCIVKKQDW